MKLPWASAIRPKLRDVQVSGLDNNYSLFTHVFLMCTDPGFRHWFVCGVCRLQSGRRTPNVTGGCCQEWLLRTRRISPRAVTGWPVTSEFLWLKLQLKNHKINLTYILELFKEYYPHAEQVQTRLSNVLWPCCPCYNLNMTEVEIAECPRFTENYLLVHS